MEGEKRGNLGFVISKWFFYIGFGVFLFLMRWVSFFHSFILLFPPLPLGGLDLMRV